MDNKRRPQKSFQKNKEWVKPAPQEEDENRLEGRKGFCGQTASLKVARAALHMWEEPCISGTRGSGTVFLPDVIWAVCSVRMDRFPEAAAVKRFR